MNSKIAALMILAVTGASARAGEGNEQKAGANSDGAPMTPRLERKDVHVEVKELANGATVTWTSKDPVRIKQIQEMARHLAGDSVDPAALNGAIRQQDWKRVNKILQSGVRHGVFGNVNLAFKMPTPESVARGKRLFEDHCAICHGMDATGNGAASGSLEVPPANLLEVSKRLPNARFIMQMRYGAGDMPAWQDILDEDEMQSITHYVKSLTLIK